MKRVQRKVRELLQIAVDRALPANSWTVPLPTLFGSRRYGLSVDTSDIDLCVEAPAEVVKVGNDVRALLARGLVEGGVLRDLILDQRSLQTPKWREGGPQGTDVSVLLTDRAGTRRALSITEFWHGCCSSK